MLILLIIIIECLDKNQALTSTRLTSARTGKLLIGPTKEKASLSSVQRTKMPFRVT